MNALAEENLFSCPAGTIVAAPGPLYEHVGLLTGHYLVGQRTVYSFSRAAGGFVEQVISQFAPNGSVVVKGYPSILPPELVLQRAQSWRGLPYLLWERNCEHFVNFAHGLEVRSRQVMQWGALAALVVGTLALARM